MALNSAHSQDGRGVVIYNGEMILIFAKEVNVSFEGYSGNEPAFGGKKKGALYLTTHRIIFVNKDQKDRMLSLAMPFHCLHGVKLEQPVFGANYLKGQVLAQPGGGWEGEVTFKLTFNSGGCIEFGQAMLHANELASRYQQYAAPPPYMAPPGGYFQPPPAYYTPQPGQPVYGFQPPTNAFPDYPPAGGVYMYDAPPPYSGIGPTPPPYPGPGGAGGTGAVSGGMHQAPNSKEFEAMQSSHAAQNGYAAQRMNDPPPPSYEDTMKNAPSAPKQ